VHSSVECLHKSQLRWINDTTLMPLVNSNFDADEVNDIYRHDYDGEILRLSFWLSSIVDEEEDPDAELLEMREKALLVLNNLVHRDSDSQDGIMTANSFMVTQAAAVCSIYAQCVPRDFPCENRLTEQDWNYMTEDIEKHWTDSSPRVFRQWKTALAELFKWSRQGERDAGRYIRLQQCVLLESLAHSGGRVPVNALSLGVFLMKKCTEFGGAIALNSKLVSLWDYAEFVADYYSMIRLYNKTFPKVLEWRERTVAQHRMMFSNPSATGDGRYCDDWSGVD
jgi:hypothetical protein